MTNLLTRLRADADAAAREASRWRWVGINLYDAELSERVRLIRDAADEIERLRDRLGGLEKKREGFCPWDAVDDNRADIEKAEPCPVCGMLGTPDAEDKCIGGPRRDPTSFPIVKAGEST